MVRNILFSEERCSGCCACMLTCSFTYHKVFSLNMSRVRISRDERNGGFKAFFTPECTRCGICVKSCFFNALKIEEV
jgi:ferredoxin